MMVTHVIAPGPFAGAERVVLGGLDALAADGHDVRLAVLREKRAPEHAEALAQRASDAGHVVERIDVDGRLDRRAVRALAAIPGQIVHTHGYKGTLFMRFATPRRSSAWVATHHGATSSSWRVRVYQRLLYDTYNACDAVVAVSAVTEALLRRDGVRGGRLETIENFLAVAAVPPPERRPDQTVRALVLGRLSREKGIDVLLKALSSTPTRARIRLCIVGEGPERGALEQQTRELGLGEQVCFAGAVTDVRPHLADADLLCLPSFVEGLPMTLVEALCSGRPCLASAVGGVPDVLPPGAGQLLPPGDVRAWRDALDALSGTLPNLQRAAVGAMETMKARFAPQRWANETSAMYTRALARAAR